MSDSYGYSAMPGPGTAAKPRTPPAPALTRVSADKMNLVWTSPGDATRFDVYRTSINPDEPNAVFLKIASINSKGGVPDLSGDFYTLQNASLSDKTQYWYRLVAVNRAMNSDPSPMATLSPPPVPTGLAAQRISTTEIDLAWNPVLDSNGVQVFRSTDQVNYSLLVDDDGPAPFSYADTTVQAGVQYWYRIRVYGFNGYSLLTAAVTTPAPAFRQAKALRAAGQASSGPLAFNSPVQQGSLLVVATADAGKTGSPGVTVTDSLGNTYAQAGSYVAAGPSDNGLRVSLWYTISGAAGSCSVTVANGLGALSGEFFVGILEYTGVRQTSPLRNTHGQYHAFDGTTAVQTGGVTAIGGDVILAAVSNGGIGLHQDVDFAADSPFSLRLHPTFLDPDLGTTNGMGLAVFDQIGAAGTTSLSGAFTLSGVANADIWVALGASFATI